MKTRELCDLAYIRDFLDPPVLCILIPVFHFDPQICHAGLIFIKKGSHDCYLEGLMENPEASCLLLQCNSE